MSDAAWGTLSNQAVAAAGVVYFLALLAYVVEWSSLRQSERASARSASVSTSADGGSVATTTGPDDDVRRATGSRSSAGSRCC